MFDWLHKQWLMVRFRQSLAFLVFNWFRKPKLPPPPSNECPSCHLVVPRPAVICVKCRLDLRTGKMLVAGGRDESTVVFPFGCPGAKLTYSGGYLIRKESCFKLGAVEVHNWKFIGAVEDNLKFKCSHCDKIYKVTKTRKGYRWRAEKATGWCNVEDCPCCGTPLGVYSSEFPDGDSGSVELRCCCPKDDDFSRPPLYR